MIGSRRAAITAALIGALLVAGAPTFAFGNGEATHQAKAYSAAGTSDEVTAQKAKDDDKADNKSGDNKKASGNAKKDSVKNQKDDNRHAGKTKADDPKPSDKGKHKGGDDNNKASDRPRHDNGQNGKDKKAKDADDRDWKRANDDKKSNDPHRDDWKNRRHDDKWDKDWDHNRDRDHYRRHYDWDTHRHYYRYGYYGPGWYDDCGYYNPGWDGYSNDYYYYGPDACGYEYGPYRSHFLVDMSWDQVVPRPGPEGAVGTANLDIDVPSGVVCFRLAYDGIDRAIGAQIHPGRLGEGGPNLVLLHVGQNGDDGCVGADPRLLSEIQNDPRGYYLEIDDENGPAMRGQLDAPDYRSGYAY
jgi:hypothetical protein